MEKERQLEMIDRFISANRDNMVRDINELVSIDSVKDKAAPGAPFGVGPRKALDRALAMAMQMGLSTSDGDGYVGYAEVAGDKKGYLATITHLDTVPLGEGWDGDALVMREKDGWLIGRGVSDNKGPCVLCLYIAKFFKDNNIPLQYGLRVLLGTDEESGMSDVPYYLSRHEEPLFCFSPDSFFPVCNGEKGIYEGEFVSGPLSGNIVSFSGGVASNVIPQNAECVVKAEGKPLPDTDRVKAEALDGGLVRLRAEGIAGHAANPEGTVNAIGLLVAYLLDNGLCSGAESRFLQLMRLLHGTADGSGLGIACADERFTPLTCIGGVIELKDGQVRQNINIRYPAAITGGDITRALSAAAGEYGAGFEMISDAKPFYIEADSEPIHILSQVYGEVIAEPAKPFTMGGGTYARHFANAVSFGPAMDDQRSRYPAFAGPSHGPNEGVLMDDLLRAMKGYILALWRMQDVAF